AEAAAQGTISTRARAMTQRLARDAWTLAPRTVLPVSDAGRLVVIDRGAPTSTLTASAYRRSFRCCWQSLARCTRRNADRSGRRHHGRVQVEALRRAESASKCCSRKFDVVRGAGEAASLVAPRCERDHRLDVRHRAVCGAQRRGEDAGRPP